MTLSAALSLSPEVSAALAANQPVVVLESTIIAHGFPYPVNLKMAHDVEAIIRQGGAIPATVAILDGKLCVGLSESQLEFIAHTPGLPKASLRDLPLLVAAGKSGATTVASTTTIAALAGIGVFVTGGIGGVHRGWEGTLDISADLTVLSRESLLVVCAGAKSVLDLPATLEVLETLGVTTLGYRTDRFPAFYLRDSALGVDGRVDTPAEAAAVLLARRSLGLPGAVLLANPIPPADELDRVELERVISQALRELAEQGLAGRSVTPFLLRRLHEVSGGKSVQANLALVNNNAALGARTAVELCKQMAGDAHHDA
ncbi:MAG: pseudouridine-5'-phosphate glycosidase [Symbiobacteriia bacterium]